MTVEVGVNRRAGTGQSVTAAVFIVMAAGSIAVIPLLAANLDRRALGLAACVLTLVFWVGFIGAICCVGEILNTPTRAFLLTSDWQLYYVHFAARDYGPAPVTKAGEIVHNYKVLSEEKKGRKWRREYLGSEEFRSMAQQYLEGVRTDTMGCVIEHLQTPSIRSEGIDGSMLRYWDGTRKKWATIRLLRTNTGYEKICRTVKLRQELGR